MHSATLSGVSQETIKKWEGSFDERTHYADFASFQSRFPFESVSKTPALKSQVPALDVLEEALQPWGESKAIENLAMQVLMGENALRLRQLHALYSLYKADLETHFSKSNLPHSFIWLPALVNQFNHAHSNGSQNAGLWNNTKELALNQGLTISSKIDERFIPDKSTQAAISSLLKLQRRFPENPERVLVAYVKGMAYATRWTGKPGYDADLDEWLALYKVISRLMVNVQLEDRSLDWVQLMAEWNALPCNQIVLRSDVLKQMSMTETELNQLIPWWIGNSIGCEELTNRQVRLPVLGPLASQSTISTDASTTIPLETLDEPIAESAAYDEGIKCLLHEVKEGDTLWNISKRYPGTTPEWITEINGIKDYIRIGQVLCIPRIP